MIIITLIILILLIFNSNLWKVWGYSIC